MTMKHPLVEEIFQYTTRNIVDAFYISVEEYMEANAREAFRGCRSFTGKEKYELKINNVRIRTFQYYEAGEKQ